MESLGNACVIRPFMDDFAVNVRFLGKCALSYVWHPPSCDDTAWTPSPVPLHIQGPHSDFPPLEPWVKINFFCLYATGPPVFCYATENRLREVYSTKSYSRYQNPVVLLKLAPMKSPSNGWSTFSPKTSAWQQVEEVCIRTYNLREGPVSAVTHRQATTAGAESCANSRVFSLLSF